MSQTRIPVRQGSNPLEEPAWVRYVLIALALAFMGLFLLVPLVSVFAEALRRGWGSTLPPLPIPMRWMPSG